MNQTVAMMNANDLAKTMIDHIQSRTADQRRQDLIDAGVLTRAGNVTKTYKPLFQKPTNPKRKKVGS